ncbi:hypothetical protein [Sulfuricurvum sp.]|uniref:hypothetical protein n=1 Tax=Sulfuricurvum sp. TaxID=2025608 RepID=UPI0035634DA4
MIIGYIMLAIFAIALIAVLFCAFGWREAVFVLGGTLICVTWLAIAAYLIEKK